MSVPACPPKVSSNRCLQCESDVQFGPETPASGVAPCPHCAASLWYFQQLDGLHVFGKVVADKTIAVAAKHLDVPKEQLTPLTPFAECGADSLMIVEITMELETAFDLVFPEEVDHAVHTVGDAVRLVEQCLAKKKA